MKSYASVIGMTEDIGLPKSLIDKVKAQIEEDKRNLKIVKRNGKVFHVDKRTGKKL